MIERAYLFTQRQWKPQPSGATKGLTPHFHQILPFYTPLSSHGKWDGWGFIVAIIRCLNGNELLLGTQGYNGIVDATETPSEYIVNQTQCVPVGIECLENK